MKKTIPLIALGLTVLTVLGFTGCPPQGREWTVLPDVVGLPESHARDVLESMGLTVSIDPASHPTAPLYEVTRQTPAAGDEVPLGSTVVLTVSSGPGGEGEGEVTPGEMVSIDAGWFEMGRPYTDTGWPGEVPVHDVYLSAYAIGKYPVTNQEYADILNWAHARGRLTNSSGGTYTSGLVYAHGEKMADTFSSHLSSQIEFGGGTFTVRSRDGYSMSNHPVVQVSWYGAAMYCNWLSERQGLTPVYDTSTWAANFSNNGYHLPTEAQWERAAAWDPALPRHYRYGNGSHSISCATANFRPDVNYCNPLGLTDRPYTSPVGYFAGVTSPAGCYDMAGNVWEWCNDWSRREYTEDAVTDPQGPSTGYGRVLRGGSWVQHGNFCRSAYRYSRTPDDTSNNGGFRVARTP